MKKENLIQKLKFQGFPEKIVDSFKKVDRELFVASESRNKSYEDIALPIGHNQTISQPYTIAYMLMLLEVQDGQKILEIGSGSGYVIALLSELNKSGEIIGIERIKELAEESKKKLTNYKNAKIVHGNALDFKEKDFDRIIASASFEEIPQKLINSKLKKGGKFVGPVKDKIVSLKKEINENKIKEFPGFYFVPIINNNQ